MTRSWWRTSFGQQVWDELVNGNDQVFLTLNGHFWPPGRAVMGNKARTATTAERG